MRNKIINYVQFWETNCYKNGLPEIADNRLESLGKVPSYKMLCRVILKNDFHLSTLGYEKPKTKLYKTMKYVELQTRKDFIYTLSLF